MSILENHEKSLLRPLLQRLLAANVRGLAEHGLDRFAACSPPANSRSQRRHAASGCPSGAWRPAHGSCNTNLRDEARQRRTWRSEETTSTFPASPEILCERSHRRQTVVAATGPCNAWTALAVHGQGADRVRPDTAAAPPPSLWRPHSREAHAPIAGSADSAFMLPRARNTRRPCSGRQASREALAPPHARDGCQGRRRERWDPLHSIRSRLRQSSVEHLRHARR